MATEQVLKHRLHRLGMRLSGAATMPGPCRWQVAKWRKVWWFSSLELVEDFADALASGKALPEPGLVA